MTTHTADAAADVNIFETKMDAARAAARRAAELIRSALERRGEARLLLATGNSQIDLAAFLVKEPGIDWSHVEGFHLDEYVGIAPDHPASFQHWIRTRYAEQAPFKAVHYIEGRASDIDSTLADYAARVFAGPIDVAFVGFGENGHIAFNDPHAADFGDSSLFKRVSLDDACRAQQVGEGHFKSMAEVPPEALTATCSGIFRADHWVCCVPDARKAKAVKAALEGPVTTACPASAVQTHRSASVFLDRNSASLLSTVRFGSQ